MAVLIQKLEDAFVQRAAKYRLDRIPKFTSVSSYSVRIHRLLRLPDLDNGEMVRPRCTLQNIETHVTFFLAARFRQSPQ